MLFLDDFLEMLDELPLELRERGDEIRRLDLEVDARTRQYAERRDEFFQKTGLNMSPEERTACFNQLKMEMEVIRKLTTQKVEIANRMQELLMKYQNRLEKEKMNFQCEMEADNSGVTEAIEKRYTEYVELSIAVRKERKRRRQGGGTTRKEPATVASVSRDADEKIARILKEGGSLKMDFSEDSANSALSSAVHSPAPRGRPPKNRDNLLYSSALLASDDSMAPTPTSTQRRRSNANSLRGTLTIPQSASLASSNTRLSPNVSEHSWSNMGIDESPTGTVTTPTFPQTPVSAVSSAFVGSESRHGRTRKLTTRVQEMFKETLQRQRNHGNSMQSLQDRLHSTSIHPITGTPIPQHESQNPLDEANPVESSTDTDEESNGEDDDPHGDKIWCHCRETSYGEMIKCDNKKTCPISWFHYPCVGLSAPPVSKKWYCRDCIATGTVKKKYCSQPLYIPATPSDDQN